MQRRQQRPGPTSHAFGVTLLEGEAWSLSEAIDVPHCGVLCAFA